MSESDELLNRLSESERLFHGSPVGNKIVDAICLIRSQRQRIEELERQLSERQPLDVEAVAKAYDAALSRRNLLGMSVIQREAFEDALSSYAAPARPGPTLEQYESLVRGIQAEINDPEQSDPETVGKIDMRLTEFPLAGTGCGECEKSHKADWLWQERLEVGKLLGVDASNADERLVDLVRDALRQRAEAAEAERLKVQPKPDTDLLVEARAMIGENGASISRRSAIAVMTDLVAEVERLKSDASYQCAAEWRDKCKAAKAEAERSNAERETYRREAASLEEEIYALTSGPVATAMRPLHDGLQEEAKELKSQPALRPLDVEEACGAIAADLDSIGHGFRAEAVRAGNMFELGRIVRSVLAKFGVRDTLKSDASYQCAAEWRDKCRAAKAEVDRLKTDVRNAAITEGRLRDDIERLRQASKAAKSGEEKP